MSDQRPEHPGPQKKLARRVWRNALFYPVALALVLVLFAFFKVNLSLYAWLDPDWRWWRLQLLDFPEALTFLVAVLTLFYARKQFEFGLMPLLNYRIQQSSESEHNLQAQGSCGKYMRTTLKNVGGVAVVTECSYSFGTNLGVVSNRLSYAGLVEALGQKGLVVSKDFDITFFSVGWALGANDERVIFEVSYGDPQENKVLKSITSIDIHLTFRSLLNEHYTKSIYCIPRRGIEALAEVQ